VLIAHICIIKLSLAARPSPPGQSWGGACETAPSWPARRRGASI